MIDMRMREGQISEGLEIDCGFVDVDEWTGLRMNWKEMDTNRRPRTMMGIEYKRIRRRPIRSMRTIATTVKIKFVMATAREVRVGDAKPRREKIVAEKYIKEF